jgi:hypothetical protein
MSSMERGRACSGSRICDPRAEQQRISANVSTESIESIASQAPAAAPAATCAACGSPLADDQRYCLQCGERTMPMSSVLQGGPPTAALAPAGGSQAGGPGSAPPSAPGPPGATPPAAGGGEPAGRGNAVTVIAGVGVLLLAMGIGVLIGRSGGAKPSGAAAPQVITVSSAPAAGATPASESFTGDWPAGSSGYTIQLQTLPTASTQVSAVQAAKSAAEGKGAKAVGALKSDEFTSLPAGSYIVYSGKYTKKSEADKALGPLKKNFSEAKVVHVGAGTAASNGKGAAGSGGAGKSGVGSSPSKPAPPTVVESLKGKSGKSYEQESKNLPNVVSTG